MIRHNSKSFVIVDVKSKKHVEPILMDLKESVLNKAIKTFSQGEDRVLRHQGRFYVPDVDGLGETILEDAHGSRYTIHRTATKINRDLHEIY